MFVTLQSKSVGDQQVNYYWDILSFSAIIVVIVNYILCIYIVVYLFLLSNFYQWQK